MSCRKTVPSLLKKSFVELYEEEKHWKAVSYDVYSRPNGSKIRYFAFMKAHQFSFSTGWDDFENA
jgi:hypothetical protein